MWTEIYYEKPEMKRKGFTRGEIIRLYREEVLHGEPKTRHHGADILGKNVSASTF